MIQRIQTLYLGVATVMLIVAAASLGRAGAGTEPVLMTGVIIAAVLAAVSLGTVFLYGNRGRQRKMVRAVEAGCVVLLVAIALEVFLEDGLAEILSRSGGGLVVASIAALVALGLLHFAGRAIKKDIDLVKSMDRIR
jgi:hypothetical protein